MTSQDETWSYSAYGLHLQSDRPIPGLVTSDETGPVDVHISRGPVADASFEAADSGLLWTAAPGRFRLELDDVATYLVEDGDRITIDPVAGASDEDIALFLLGSVTGALLHQRGVWPMHASAVATASGAVLFGGHSGAGKSTLLAGLLDRGYTALSDDISAIHVGADGAIQLAPALPRVKVCEDAAAHFKIKTDGLQEIPSRRKYVAPVPKFRADVIKVGRIVVLGVTGAARAEFETVDGVEAIRHLTDATFRRPFMRGLGVHASRFALVNRVAREIPITFLRRPEHLDAIEDTLDQLEELIAGR